LGNVRDKVVIVEVMVPRKDVKLIKHELDLVVEVAMRACTKYTCYKLHDKLAYFAYVAYT